MKRTITSASLLLLSAAVLAFGRGKDSKPSEDKLLGASGVYSAQGSYPQPLPAASTPAVMRLSPALSTGYYFVNSTENVSETWRPSSNEYIDTTYEPLTWRRILSGPNQLPISSFIGSPDGFRFFRNPANMADSSDNAFAGPIPIGFPFYYNGIRYDSFYVSSNGLIALSNRRYIYDTDGRKLRVDPQSDDQRSRDYTTFVGGDTTLADNWGFQAYALGIAGGGTGVGTPTGGIRNPANTTLSAFTNTAPIITPFWTDMQLSTFDRIRQVKDDFSKVHFKRFESNDKLVINFTNIMMIGQKRARGGQGFVDAGGNPIDNVLFLADARPNQNEPFVAASAQVILNAQDSSITFIYKKFDGAVTDTALVYVTEPSKNFFRDNTTIGVRGVGRHFNYTPTVPVGAVSLYNQFTEYSFNGSLRAPEKMLNGNYRLVSTDSASTFDENLAIRFKQWKNTARVVAVKYQFVDPNGNILRTPEFENFEMLAGEPLIGRVQPIVYYQNLTNNIQGINGVNFQPQPFAFVGQFRLKNDVTGEYVYGRTIPVDATTINVAGSGVRLVADTSGAALTGFNTAPQDGVPNYGLVEVAFPVYEPSLLINRQIGRFTSEASLLPRSLSGTLYGDMWPMDDTLKGKFHVMRRLPTFTDYVNEYNSVSGEGLIPSVNKWVSIGADVVDGDQFTNNPVAPRGSYKCANDSTISLNSPAIRLNRYDVRVGDWAPYNTFAAALTIPAGPVPQLPSSGPGGGDEIRSFPIDLRGRRNPVLVFNVQRTGRPVNRAGDLGTAMFDRGWSDSVLYGPEPRVIYNLNANAYIAGSNGTPPNVTANIFNNGGTTTSFNNLDRLVVEFANRSADGINNIVNIPAAGWNRHPRMSNITQAVTDNPAYTLYGGGGYNVGFQEGVADSSLSITQGLRSNIFDDGKDESFTKVFIPLPRFVWRDTTDNADITLKNFRFRIRTITYRNSSDRRNPVRDDNDDFFVDNVRVISQTETPDVEVASISISWPYTVTPPSQVTGLPIIVKVANNSTAATQSFNVQVVIQRKEDAQRGLNRYVYCRPITVPLMPENTTQDIRFPVWNARLATPGDYVISARVTYPWAATPDERQNDSTFTEFRLNFGEVFSYDPPANYLVGTNDVPAFARRTGKGLNLQGSAEGTGIPPAARPFGAEGGNSSGQFAMKFSLLAQDTINGLQAYFGGYNQSTDIVSYSIYRDQGGIPGNRINLLPNDMPPPRDRIDRRRGYDEIRDDYFFDQYVTVRLPRPLILEPGDYWVSVAQVSGLGLELGATKFRAGMHTMSYTTAPIAPILGSAGTSVSLYKGYRRARPDGVLINDNRFSFENVRFSGQWVQFAGAGNIPYAHLGHGGGLPAVPTARFTSYFSLSQGSWVPMVRPYLGSRFFGDGNGAPIYEENCQLVVPVELSNFDGLVRRNGIELFWETASERNNAGFYVEKRIAGTSETFTDIGFVAGNGNSTISHNYSLLDANVKKGVRYEYRLRSVDFDGSFEHSTSIERTFDAADMLLVEQNSPNPVTGGETMISYNVPNKSAVTITISDAFGNVIRTLFTGMHEAGQRAILWDTQDDAGHFVPSGAYICKITAGNDNAIVKMTVIR